MNHLTKILTSASLLFLIVISGCVDSAVDTTYTSPTIKLISPAKGDTIQIKDNLVVYQASDFAGGPGLASYELFINGTSAGIYQQNEDGTNPDIYINLDPSLVRTKINYAITVYNKSGAYKQSEWLDNIYVVYSNKPPRAPGGLTLTPIDANTVNLFWEDNSFNEDGFELWKKTRDNGAWTKYKTLDSSTISINDYGLSNQINYYYKIRAYNKYGYSDFSEEVSTSGSGGVLQAAAVGASAIYLTWADNTSNELGFRIERKLASQSTFSRIGTVGPNIREFTDTGLNSNTTYDYRVAHFTSTAVGEWSNTASATTWSMDVPAPSNLTASFDLDTKTVIVTWNDNTQQETGTIVERKLQGGSFEAIGSTGADVRTFTDYNTVAPNIYYYRARHTISSWIGGAYTQYSNSDSAYVPALPPDAPTNLRLFVSQNGVDDYGLVWQDNSDDEDGFELWMKEGENGIYEMYDDGDYPQNTTAALVKVPDINKVYYFKVRATRSNLYSESGEVNTASGSSGFELKVDSVGAHFVELTWPDSFTNEVAYSLVRKLSWESWTDGTSQEVALIGPFNGGEVLYRDEGLQSSTTYNYKVRAVFTNGYSAYSNEIAVTTHWQ